MKSTTRDNILYLTIALSIVGILGLVFWYQDANNLPIRFPVSDHQFAFVTITAVVFGYAIKAWRRSWREIRFWIVLSLLFAGFLPLQWFLIRSIGTRLATYSLLGVAELFALLVILDTVLPSRGERSGHTQAGESKS